jgi:hypothetical protein
MNKNFHAEKLFLTKFLEIPRVTNNAGLNSVSRHGRNNGVLLYFLQQQT